MPFSALIVDDEELTRERIRMLLAAEPRVAIAGECESGAGAIAFLEAHAVDLVFLDVQMPEIDGFGVLEALGPHRLPAVIFCTAHDRYAVRAFEVNAAEYILKPIDESRFRTALQRAIERIERHVPVQTHEQLRALIESVRKETYVKRLSIKAGERIVLIRVEEIEWIEATGNYVRIHTATGFHQLRESMQNLEARLDPASFARIHRSAIVHLDRIRELHPLFHGDYSVVLQSGRRLTLSRRYKHRLDAELRRFL